MPRISAAKVDIWQLMRVVAKFLVDTVERNIARWVATERL